MTIVGRKLDLTEITKHLVLLIGAIIVLLPFYIMVSYSLKSPGEIERNEGGFFGAQELMVDERCVKLREPDRDAIAEAKPRFPNLSDTEIYESLVKDITAECSMRPVVFNYTKAF
ncbi:MAG: carbohydrate ABC transporter permease, partial [Chloroflexota bacterium]